MTQSCSMAFAKLAAVALPVLMLAAGASAQTAKHPKPLMKDFMGINAHTVQFPVELYKPVCRLVRDYHPYIWDVNGKPGADTTFPMAQYIGWKDTSGKFRDWNRPVDWQELYGGWVKAGMEIDATIQIEAVAYNQWPNRQQDLTKYAKAFAEYFGPSHRNLVTSAEIGNEPAGDKKYTPEQYKEVFRIMARALRAGDPKLKIVSCAVQAGESDGYCQPIDVLRGESDLYDVINLHQYALLKGWPSFERTFPEDPQFPFIGRLQEAIQWRDQNAPGKPVWITEFGYDASTKKPADNNKDWKSATDLQQAQWITRSFLTLSEIDLERAYLYFFNDDDAPSFHASSGITRHLTPKPSYWAMKHLYQALGDYRFSRAIEKKPGGNYVYEYVRDGDAKDRIWVLWSATGTGRTETMKPQFPGKVVKAERMPLTDGSAEVVDASTLSISESPIYIWLKMP